MCIRDSYKTDAGKMMVGAFEPKAKPWGMAGIREDFEFDTLPEDWDHFQPILEDAMNRMPPVSYTHLDVYKRQGPRGATRSFLRCTTGPRRSARSIRPIMAGSGRSGMPVPAMIPRKRRSVLGTARGRGSVR